MRMFPAASHTGREALYGVVNDNAIKEKSAISICVCVCVCALYKYRYQEQTSFNDYIPTSAVHAMKPVFQVEWCITVRVCVKAG